MASSESFKERQDDEFEILQSIYGDDIDDLRKNDAWKIPRPPEFILKLNPQEGMSGRKEAYTHLDLRIKFPPLYPECCPEIKIENAKGLAMNDLNELDRRLKDFCKSSVGEVMVLQLAQFVQEYLHNHNVPTFKSAYEEMVRNKQKMLEEEEKVERKKREMQRRKEEIQRREIEEELARRQEEEKKLRKLKREERDGATLPERPRQNSEGSCRADPPSTQTGVKQLNFLGKSPRTITRGECLRKGNSGGLVFIGMDASSGCSVAVHHWRIICPIQQAIVTDAERAKVDKYLKAINTVEQELHSLVKFEHANLVSYLGMKTTHCKGCIEVDLLQEYIHGISLQQMIENNNKVSLDALRTYTEEMLLALDHLHTKSVVHKHFKASSIFLESNGAIKVADFSIVKRMSDLYEESQIVQPGVRFSDDQIPARMSKKGDILRLGIVVLSLAQGTTITDYPPEVSSVFSPVFQDFLDKCLVVEDRLRMSASELLKHEFIKPSILSLDAHLETKDISVDDAPYADEDPLDLYDQSGEQSHPLQLSRLHSEFEELEWLGKGGYGNVVKVRNKLDDRHYAIKRIHLNPNQSQFNKKITREVKLLSRLNHENVVRYYNSWIETLHDYHDDISITSSSIPTTTTSSKPSTDEYVNSLGLSDDIERLAPPPVHSSTSEWSVSVEEVSRHGDLDDDDDDQDEFKFIYVDNEMSSSSESVMFDHSDAESNEDHDVAEEESKPTLESTTDTSSSKSVVARRFLYIQMEYCEKSTLRQTIDAGLCQDHERMWRLFREILEGLCHVHEQGMIHRDLKPQNIFLDRNDHVKIGDFGLATSRSRAISPDVAGSNSEGTDSVLSGAVGTALYVAPELMSSSKRLVYSQKVDIYSVGIIFFEMFYPGITTKMERVKILGGLRMPSITLPRDFDEVAMEREAAITKLCLQHEPNDRPTAAGLLKCRHVPTPVLEESDVLEAIREMMSDPNSKPHRLVLDEIFNQPVNQTTSVMYDVEMYKHQFNVTASLIQEQTHEIVSSILRRHGSVCVSTPLLMPHQGFEPEMLEAATFIDRGGTVVNLPHNLRVPFARYVSFNSISNLKRYAIEKVFRARKIRCSRPKELWECAFDIVTPTLGGLIPDAEVIYSVSEIISHFPSLASRKYTVRINHMVALKAIFTHCGLADEYHADALTSLASCDRMSKTKVDACLSGLPLSHQQRASLSSFTQIEGTLSKVQASLKPITRNKQKEASSWARQALHELEVIQRNLDYFSMDLTVTYDLGLAHKHHQHYNGMIFQVSAEIQRKRRTAIDILALGGRYDKLLESMGYLRVHGEPGAKESDFKPSQPCVVGVSVAIEKVVAAAAASNNLASSTSLFTSSPRRYASTDVLVCSVGRCQLLKERLGIVTSLWKASICAVTPYEKNVGVSVQDMQEKAQKRGVSHLVLINDKERGVVVVKSFIQDANAKVVERKVPLEQLVEYLNKRLQGIEDGNTGSCNLKFSGQLISSSTSTTDNLQSTNHGGTRHLSIELLPPDKLAFNVKKRLEFEIRTKLSNLSLMSNLSNKAVVWAIAVELPSTVMKQLGCGLDLSGDEERFNSSLAHHFQSTPKHKKYISCIAEKVREAKFKKDVPFIILFSYKDDGYFLLG